MANKIKCGDKVIVITGKDKGKIGEVQQVLNASGKLLVSGINIVKVANKNKEKEASDFIQKENYVAVSNVLLLDQESSKPTRVGFKFLQDGKKVRFLKRSGKVLNELNKEPQD